MFNTRISSYSVDINNSPASSDAYRNTYGILEKLDACDAQLIEFKRLGSNRSTLDFGHSFQESQWSRAKEFQIGLYTKQLKEVKQYLIHNSIFSQNIGFYSDKIHAKEDPELALLVRRGILSATASLICGGLSLIFCMMIPHINYRLSSKLNETMTVYPLLVVATVLFFTAAYVFNLASLIALKAKVMALGLQLDQDVELNDLYRQLDDISSSANEFSLQSMDASAEG